MNIYPSRTVGSSLPAAQSVTALLSGTEALRDIPAHFSHVSAEIPVADGVYTDQSGRGHHWTQPVVGSRPAVVDDALGTGFKAWNHPNDNSKKLLADFIMPTGDFTFAALASLAADAPAADANMYALLGSNATTAANRFVIGIYNRKFRINCHGNTKDAQSAGLSLEEPHVLVACYSTSANRVSVRVDGGAWIHSAALGNNEGHRDVTAQIGYSFTSYFPEPHRGLIWDVMIEATDLAHASNAGYLAEIESFLAAKGGIDLP